MRYARSSMLEVLTQDYMRTAQAKGLDRMTITLRHGLRNALIPLVTVLGLDLADAVRRLGRGRDHLPVAGQSGFCSSTPWWIATAR